MKVFLRGWFNKYLELVRPKFWSVTFACSVFAIAGSILAMMDQNLGWVLWGLQMTLVAFVLYVIILAALMALLYAPFKTKIR